MVKEEPILGCCTEAEWHVATGGMYVLQHVETVVESEYTMDGMGPFGAIQNRLVDDPDSRQDAPAGVIWDGTSSQVSCMISV